MTYEEILQTMTQEFTDLAGFSPDNASDVGIRMKVLASQLYELGLKTDYLSKQMFPQTAEGEYLDLHGQTRGVTRRQATPAKGELTFSRQSPSSQDILIPQGTGCAVSQNPQLRFSTTREGVLSAGQVEVTLPAQSDQGGAAYNVAAGQIDVLVTPPQGISHVTNKAPFTDGVDTEEDLSLRNRLISSFQIISNGTNTAYYYDETMKDEGVLSANVLPRVRGRGTVDIVVKGKPGVDETGLVQRLTQQFSQTKEINVDILVRTPTILTEDCQVSVAVLDGHAFTTVSGEVEKVVGEFFSQIGIGNPIYRAALVSAIYQVPGVANCSLISPQTDLPQDGDALFVLGDVKVEEMVLES